VSGAGCQVSEKPVLAYLLPDLGNSRSQLSLLAVNGFLALTLSTWHLTPALSEVRVCQT